MKPLPDYDELHRIFCYDPETGLLTSKIRRSTRLDVGDVVGTNDAQGYITITLHYKKYKAHRLIYKMMTGEDPEFIDHINQDRSDNRWVNLRSCTALQNRYNSKCKSPHKDIFITDRKSPYRVRVRYDGKRINVGSYATLEEAIIARDEVLAKYHGEFANYG